MDLFHVVSPEEPEVMAQGPNALFAALGKGTAETSVRDVEGGLKGVKSQEGVPEEPTPAGGPGGVEGGTGGHIVEEGLQDIKKTVQVIEGAASPDMEKRHVSATEADLSEGELAVPGGAKGEGDSGVLPKELTEAHGDVNGPKRGKVGGDIQVDVEVVH